MLPRWSRVSEVEARAGCIHRERQPESRIGRDTWVSPSASFLEAAVRTAPREPFAEQAYALLEEAAILGWASEDSLLLPPDVERRLAELRALLDAR